MRHEEPGEAVTSDDPSSPQAASGRPAWYRRRWFAIVGLVAVFVVALMLLLYVPVRATSTSSYCSSCHPTKVAKTTWQHSVHAKVSCVACHVPPGLGPSLAWRTREWVNIWATYLNIKNVSANRSLPANANCTSCHSLKALGPTTTDIRISHQVHVKLHGLRCVDCHDRVAHALPGQSTTVSMTVCEMCHSQTTRQDQCLFCHKTPPPANVHPANYIAVHGKQALANGADCLRCHHSKASFCDPCHARPTPDHSSPTWRYTHAGPARADRAACLGCHNQQTFCMQCHQVTHPSDWVSVHGPIAAQGGTPCLVCHQQSFCSACHTRMGIKP
jgi:nitrate/TMAO reductase-like tetraheme cytochrome c subunit